MKRILMVQHADGTEETICPMCKYKMTWRDLGIVQSVQAGELVEQDLGGFWECLNKKCGYQSDE